MPKAERTPIRNRGLTMIPVDQEKRHDEWLGIRRGYLGGSDAGAIIGTNPYNSAFSVWAEKTSKVPEFGGNISTRVGSYLEDLVAKLFEEETGKKVQRLKFTLINPKYNFACANIDREIIGEDALLEIKTTTSMGAIKQFRSGEYPEQWYAQMVHYLAVTGCRKAYLAALENNRELRIFELERDEAEIQALMDAERDFWNNYVVPKRTPPVDGHSATSDAIRQMFQTDSAGIEADLNGMDRLFERRKVLTEQQKAIKEQIDALDNQIKVSMGSLSRATCGRWTVSWKIQNTGLDRERIKKDFPSLDFSKYTGQSRVFRITEKKVKTA